MRIEVDSEGSRFLRQPRRVLAAVWLVLLAGAVVAPWWVPRGVLAPVMASLFLMGALASLGIFSWHFYWKSRAQIAMLAKAHDHLLVVREAQLQTVLDNTPAIAVQQYDQQGRVLYWNRASEALYGYSAAQTLGKTLDQLMWTPEQTSEWLAELHSAARCGTPMQPQEITLTHQNGEQRHVLYSSFAIAEVGGSLRFICMDVDITPRKRVEDELRASRQLLETVIDAIPLSIFVKDRGSNYTLINQGFADFHHTTKQDFMGRHTMLLPAPEPTRQKSLRDDEWVFQTGQTLNQPEVLLQDAAGQSIAFHSQKIPLKDASGAVMGLLGVNRNITEEKRGQEAVRAGEARFSAMFHNSHVPQIVSNPITGTAEDVNQAFAQMSGYSQTDLKGLGIDNANKVKLLWRAEEAKQIAHVHALGGTPQAIDIHWQRADGALRLAQASAISIDTPAGSRVAWSFIDVTEQRAAQRQMAEQNLRLEQAVQQRTAELTKANLELVGAMQNLQSSQEALMRSERLAALGRMVAGVAHELNTPIGNSLLTASALTQNTDIFAKEMQTGLRRSTLTHYIASAKEACALMERNLERAAGLVRSFKQVAVDQTSSQRRAFNLKEVVSEVLASLKPTLKASRVQIQVDVDPSLQLDSYPGPFGQVVTNLVTNAVLHGYEPQAAGTVTILGRAKTINGVQYALVSVQDDGKGVAADNLKRIFDPFFTTRMGNGGTGLGLNIVHSIVIDLLGGTIAVESAPTQGARFTITLPLSAPARREAMAD